jgi:hypothetical protein
MGDQVFAQVFALMTALAAVAMAVGFLLTGNP